MPGAVSEPRADTIFSAAGVQLCGEELTLLRHDVSEVPGCV